MKLDVDSLKRTVDSGKIQFKSSLGVELTSNIELKDKIDKTIREPKGFQEYLNDAFKNRYEIFSADRDLKEYERSFDTIKDRKSTRLNSSHANISYAVFCLKKKKKT